jgi:hypothetical protein
MRSNLSIVFGANEVSVNLPADGATLSAAEARRWLDEQFIANDCEPVRPTGKVLTADKLLAIASAIGQRGLEQDEALRLAFARAATAALAHPVVRIDVDARSVSY